jgi:hypothetical protein
MSELYRKKPILVRAEQFDNSDEMAARFNLARVETHDHNGQSWHWAIVTLEGKMRVNVGDWIITGIAGERYPCKPEIFEITYEPFLP